MHHHALHHTPHQTLKEVKKGEDYICRIDSSLVGVILNYFCMIMIMQDQFLFSDDLVDT
jgi:hypothetical protein